MVSQATTIRDSLETNWSLTGNLSKTVSGNMREIVRFFDRDQVEGNEWPKAVTVRKINKEGEENRVEHPKFTTVSDVYRVTVFFRVTDVDPTVYSAALESIEDMASEVERILALTYKPSTPNGTFFTASHKWENLDHRDQAQVDLRRMLTFELQKITSEEPEVFTGFGGVLAFDTSLSVADSKSVSDYVYTEAYNVELNEGYEVIPYLTNDTTDGQNVPQLSTGIWNGQFEMQTMLKKSDVQGATVERLHNLYKTQLNSPLRNELPTIVLLQSDLNTETVPATLTTTTFLKVTNIRKVSDTEQLTKYTLTGRIIKPPPDRDWETS